MLALSDNNQVDKLGVYIHWPFCEHKCPYCDFNSHVRDTVDQADYLKGYVAEIEYYARLTGGQKVASIFFGGGTPSLMNPETLAALIKAVRENWSCADTLEISMEANPSSVEQSRFQAYRDAGVNRISIGVQSLRPDVLKFLGRIHNVDAALKAIETAKSIFPRYSFDLIYARPDQTMADWAKELTDALSIAGDHLSLYQLTIEPETAFFGQHKKGVFQLPEEDLAADLYELTEELCAARGLLGYETSNYAKLGQECVHNLIYWQGDNYIGIGPGAHGRYQTDSAETAGVRATFNVRKPEGWLAATIKEGRGIAEENAIDADERALELILTGLRLASGINKTRFRQKSGRDLIDFIDAGKLDMLVDEGFIEQSEHFIRTTKKGRPLLNTLLGQLVR